MDVMGLRQLATTIQNYCGIDYLENLALLESKVAAHIAALGLSYWEYSGYLKMEPAEWDALIELITVNETYFFREENLLRELQTAIFPQYRQATPENPLRIWCAACSSGEEPYTLAMLLVDSRLFQPDCVKILASDINRKVLERGKRGLYSRTSFSFRKMPVGALEKFFDERGECYAVKEEIQRMVEFRQINLLAPNLAQLVGRFDIVLCRNVLIYFDGAAVQHLIQQFQQVLEGCGYLLLGHSEALTLYQHGFDTVYKEHIFYYRKGGNLLCDRLGC